VDTKKKIILFSAIFLFSLALTPYMIPLPDDLLTPGDLAHSKSNFIEVKGVTLHYETHSPKTHNDTVVFVHGFGGSTFSFQNNIQPLNEAGFQVVLVDMPGFGLSERTLETNHSHKGRAELLLALLDEIDPDSSVHWVGHSMGGNIISWIPTIDQNRTSSLTIIASPFSNSTNKKAKALLSFPPAQRALAVGFPRFITPERIATFLESAYQRPLSSEEIEGYYLPLKIRDTHLTLIGLIRDRMSFPPDYERIQYPTLLIWGDADSWVPLENALDWKAAIACNQMKIIPDAGHNVMETHSEEFNAHLIHFILHQVPAINP